MPVRDRQTVKRLKKRREFLAVRAGEKRRGRLFLLETLDRGEPEAAPRVGFTVSKKVGNAAVRNRVRRRLREAVRLAAADAMAPGNDYVIVGRREILDADFRALAAELVRRVAPASPPRASNEARPAMPPQRSLKSPAWKTTATS